ncbi:LLM class flavin-dependent oxidoreductase [Lentzea sp. NEAU-D7]|uniref:LLM class flavin-dependent oxidoreductase n=1 Tax=Lentzea sp. NEAU-D7 TaxID=2994667 RepID=UPI002B0573EA|nr:LLM class flavin-dependent oxidoreductase [Lentzea sp. NEAU-D7]
MELRSVLDTSPIVQGSAPREALRNTVDLAELAEELGFHRYWGPEHHGMRGVAGAVLVAHLAAVTEHLRVGAGGVLLPNHPPLVVARSRPCAPAGSISASAARRAVRRPRSWHCAAPTGRTASSWSNCGPCSPPPAPRPCRCGAATCRSCGCSSPSTSELAAELDMRFAGPIRTKVRRRQEGDRIPLPNPRDAAVLPDDGRVLTGGPETITRGLQAVLDDTGTSELMITSPVHHHADRRRGYELISAISGSLTPVAP